MANDILNTDGTTTGNQNMGDVIVNLPGRNGVEDQAHKIDDARRITLAVSDVADKYDGDFSQVRYYTGDLPT